MEPLEWRKAYLEFETQAEEIKKFERRFRWAGLHQWDRTLKGADLFCGRGSGLVALEKLGFNDLVGVDWSADLSASFKGRARILIADCRDLPITDQSLDFVTVQGGLHHLPHLPVDLEKVFKEISRVLKPGARFLAVEPWTTPFLSLVHISIQTPLRKAWRKLDALGRMIEGERQTYENWLARPQEILDLLEKYFRCEKRGIGFGKLYYLGRKT